MIAKKTGVMCVVLLLLVSVIGVAVGFTGGGDFEDEVEANDFTGDVIEIHTWEDLHNMRDDLTGDYVLMNDLGPEDEGYDEYASDQADDGSGWLPVSTFTGSFDGQNYNITGLYIDRPSTNYVGLFGITGGESTVKGINMLDVEITGDEYVGALVGENEEGSSLFNNHASGILNGGYRAGGLVGRNGGTLYQSSSYVEVNSGSDTGGLVGIVMNSGVVENSYATGNVSGNYIVGGLVGLNNGLVNNSYATGNVSGSGNVGGLVGDQRGTTDNSYSIGLVTGSSNVGGLLGINSGSVSNSYSTGDVSGDETVGGLLGRNRRGTVSNSHYNIDSVLINDGYHVTIGGIFDEQYEDWFDNGFYLDIEYYSETLIPVDDHYEIISTDGIRDLLGFADREGYEFHLAADIDLSDEPGLYVPYLAAVFNGNNHTISDLHLDMPFAAHIGMFGSVDGGEVRNVGVVDVDVSSDWYIGGLVGYDWYGTVSNSYATGSVSGDRVVGGLVGRNMGGMVENSYATGNVSGDWNVGGLVGLNMGGMVENSYATGSVSGTDWNVGGLVGSNSATVSNSYAMGNVSGGEWDVGGLVGRNDGTVDNSYAMGNVSGDSWVGGLVGLNGGTVSNSYATGNVSGAEGIGGLVGWNDGGTVSNSFYNVDSVLINGDYHVTIGGIFDEQYEDWFNNGLSLDIDDYNETLIPVDDYYEIKNTDSLRDMLGFADREGYMFHLGADIDLSGEPGLYIPYLEAGFYGINYTISNLYIDISFASHMGMFGYVNEGKISDVGLIDVDVSGDWWVGGLVGRNYEGTVENSYATGSVSGYHHVGGLAGRNDGTVSNSYSMANVSGTGWRIGGLVGRNTGAVSDSYSTGHVSGGSGLGGLVAWNDGGTVENSFWDIDTSGQAGSAGGTGKNTAEMNDVATFTNTTDTEGLDEPWDFIGNPHDDEGVKNIWHIDQEINDGYPFLSWQDFGLDIHTLEINIEGEGDVEVYGQSIDTPYLGYFEHGYEVDLTSVAAENWNFVEWTGDNESNDENLTITMDDDIEVTSHFAINQYTLTVDEEEGGTVDIDPDQTEYEHGTEVDLKAIADDCWNFLEWTGDVPEGEEENEEITIVMDGDKKITAQFEAVIPPSIEIFAPDDGATLGTSFVTIEWNFQGGTYPVSHNEIRLNDGDWINVGLGTHYTFQGVEDGEYTVTVRAVDTEGCYNKDTVSFIVDTQEPEFIPPR